ncbi:urate oxidase [Bradyrhizobium sp. AUGA SZCCT0051]|nr:MULTISPECIES: urate oxidase [unclassified Bradyrhizobium]MBR1206019.1 urate oxidase [Bradyrhizobium sp. AUGA SZCCT0124]MBR1314854.1 urate oxidase [Bradyrhizobium sp. AUGA SZCCT0051]MBR1341825.1 urate oxidase [Bradyrhizobium sp. AUGA SZCCT0105]MBR1358773.1 urate oxidase [Bradyrhizobium sp. AUGA SZCCT0045]
MPAPGAIAGGFDVPLIKNRYGKGRVRVMRIHRDGERQEVSQLNIKAMVEGEFARTYTHADNIMTVSTDTIKNIVNVVARENTGLCAEEFCQVLARKYLDTYQQISSVAITSHETKWSRLSFDGKPHPHSFVLDANGRPTVEATMTRDGSSTLSSGVDGFAFLKSTQSGWENYLKDRYTTIPETADRICATSMVASWAWSAKPANYPATNAKILDTMLRVFSTTYSRSVQDSLYRMGEAALAAVPEISEISMACPNMHFIPINLSAFGLDNNNDVFLPTDEPHGQIECTVGRK